MAKTNDRTVQAWDLQVGDVIERFGEIDYISKSNPADGVFVRTPGRKLYYDASEQVTVCAARVEAL